MGKGRCMFVFFHSQLNENKIPPEKNTLGWISSKVIHITSCAHECSWNIQIYSQTVICSNIAFGKKTKLQIWIGTLLFELIASTPLYPQLYILAFSTNISRSNDWWAERDHTECSRSWNALTILDWRFCVCFAVYLACCLLFCWRGRLPNEFFCFTVCLGRRGWYCVCWICRRRTSTRSNGRMKRNSFRKLWFSCFRKP